MDKNFIKMYLLALALTGAIAGVCYILYSVGPLNIACFVAAAILSRIGYVLYKDLQMYKEKRH